MPFGAGGNERTSQLCSIIYPLQGAMVTSIETYDSPIQGAELKPLYDWIYPVVAI